MIWTVSLKGDEDRPFNVEDRDIEPFLRVLLKNQSDGFVVLPRGPIIPMVDPRAQHPAHAAAPWTWGQQIEEKERKR